MQISMIPMGYITLDQGAAGNRYHRYTEFDALLNDLGDVVLRQGDLTKVYKIQEDLLRLHSMNAKAMVGNTIIYDPCYAQLEDANTIHGSVRLIGASITRNTWYEIVNIDDLIDDINYLSQRIKLYYNLQNQPVESTGNHVQYFSWQGVNLTIGDTGESVAYDDATRVITYVRRNPGQQDNGILIKLPTVGAELVTSMHLKPEMDIVVEQSSLANNIAQWTIQMVDGTFVRR